MSVSEALFKPFFPFFFFVISCSFIFFSQGKPQSIDRRYTDCAPKTCGNGLNISYPFRIDSQPLYCAYPSFNLSCNRKGEPVLKMPYNQNFIIRSISYDDQSLLVIKEEFLADPCPHPLQNLTIEGMFRVSDANALFYFFYNCTSSPPQTPNVHPVSCVGNSTQRSFASFNNSMGSTRSCESSVIAPVLNNKGDLKRSADYLGILKMGFFLEWTANNCTRCSRSGGRCGSNQTYFVCFCKDRPHNVSCKPSERHKSKRALFIGLSAGLGGGFLLVVLFGLLYWRHRKKHNPSSSNLLSRNLSSDPYSKSELEKGIQTQIFSYKELEEATNNFDPSKELGDGGFGAVYHGKLRDGRVVAIKRLYDNNYKRVEQFKNEIDILSRLRHKNLVSLYGCSTRHSRELLLVYEFIPNGTVAGHLHGDRVKPGVLTWPIRLSIAIETADALAYLHKVDVIHRDVKTDNILLDNNFCVKVADFGLSRLFPTDVTHVSTAPQGTPGYVDPDYHKCYQLTDKSDVYSFGVVLVELISSMPAVDISRHRHEINLANMAINKIHSDSLHELVDSTLGFDSDFHVRRMITMVAELAFRCLQDEKDVRPSMEEVLEVLRSIENGEDKVQKTEEVVTPAADEVALLKKIPPLSPDAVTDAWVSRTSTPNTSG